tara:strand:+ start:231 stop:428 length:198 start_codon:yes stop_codon:yes gene_type:complete
LGDLAVGGRNWDSNLGSVLLVSDYLLDMEAPSSSVDSEDLANFTLDAVFLATTLDMDGVSLPDGH